MMHIPLMFVRMAGISFSDLPCRKKKNRMTARVSMFQPLLQEKTCNSAREQTPLSNNTIDSVLRHRELGQDKDLSEPPHKPQMSLWR